MADVSVQGTLVDLMNLLAGLSRLYLSETVKSISMGIFLRNSVYTWNICDFLLETRISGLEFKCIIIYYH